MVWAINQAGMLLAAPTIVKHFTERGRQIRSAKRPRWRAGQVLVLLHGTHGSIWLIGEALLLLQLLASLKRRQMMRL